MSVLSALETRVSTRAFKDTPVDPDLITKIFGQAQQSPSNCNVQPWHTFVVSGEKKDQLSKALVDLVMTGAKPNPDFNWSVMYKGIHRKRQFGSANVLYSAMGIERGDKEGRMKSMLRNWQFFGAPHAVFFTMEKYLDIMGAVDMGIYAQTIALLLQENGISCCFQGALGQYPEPARKIFNLDENQGILFGMSFGYADDGAEVNTARTDRANLDDAVTFLG